MATRNTSSSATDRRCVPPISSITVRTKKPLKSVELSIDNQPNETNWQRRSDKELQATFHPSFDLTKSSSHQVALNVRYHHQLGPLSMPGGAKHIEIDSSELDIVDEDGGEANIWQKSYGSTLIIIHLSSGTAQSAADPKLQQESSSSSNKNSNLTSMTEQIMTICPRFRVVVIGKTGVGKSSVINTAFGIKQANESESMAGVSDINKEIISGDNNQFVLHDSNGFEPGENTNFQTVKNFIESRDKMPNVKDQIHAIWLCFGIPRADARIVETGIEQFFQLETRTPIIAVFTKYDLLVARVKKNMTGSETLVADAKKEANAIVQEACIKPLETAAGKEVPSMCVSTRKGYEDTLSNLIQLTFDLVKDKVALEASVVTAIAQRVNPSVSIEGCIAVGRMKYWKGLAASMNFAGKPMERCLDVTHSDIIAVWNLDDPFRHLRSKEFKALMANLADDLGQNNASNPNRTITVGMSMVGTIAGIVSTLGGPATPIVMPIAGCFVLAKWVYDVYQQSHDTLRRLMAYIIDLTLVMQNVFWLAAIHHVPVSRRLVKLAYISYKESIVMRDVHEEITKHVKEQTVIDRLRRDSTLNKIIELLHRNHINAAEMFASREDIGDVDFSGKDDESWG